MRLCLPRLPEWFNRPAASAAGVAATPAPFADAVLLVPIQVAMVAGVTAAYGLAFSAGFLSGLVASTVAGTGPTLTGRRSWPACSSCSPAPARSSAARPRPRRSWASRRRWGAYIAALEALFVRNQGEPPSAAEVLAEVRHPFAAQS